MIVSIYSWYWVGQITAEDSCSVSAGDCRAAIAGHRLSSAGNNQKRCTEELYTLCPRRGTALIP